MDVIELIKIQIKQISKFESSIFLDLILLHLERAEYYYKLGENDSDYYNDVIYRTNQAFEGALKEAYKVLTTKKQEDAINETPYKIEKYLESNGIFKERVLELFKNYRNEWRNKSTHDFKLFFDSNEAFIALSSVCSFTFLLMKQIIEKITFNVELEKIKTAETSIIETKKKGLKVAKGLYEVVTQLLTNTIDFSDLNGKELFEPEFTGFLKANFKEFLSFATVHEEVTIRETLRPEFIIEYGQEKIILEIKRYSSNVNKQGSIYQILTFLKYANISEGISFAINSLHNLNKFNVDEHIVKLDDKNYKIRVISN
jgi:hypothetical protein